MEDLIRWLSAHKFRAHLSAFILMILAPMALYFAAQRDALGWIWGLLAVVILANVLLIFVR
jgi:NhaP-type Na+/H+ or K+/H+ antiporter